MVSTRAGALTALPTAGKKRPAPAIRRVSKRARLDDGVDSDAGTSDDVEAGDDSSADEQANKENVVTLTTPRAHRVTTRISTDVDSPSGMLSIF
jgi:hypothetical protein